MLSEHRDEKAATAFFKQAIDGNGFPHKVVMDKSGANYAGLENINLLLMLAGLICFIEEHSCLSAVYGFGRITAPTDKCGFALFEYLRQNLYLLLKPKQGIINN